MKLLPVLTGGPTSFDFLLLSALRLSWKKTSPCHLEIQSLEVIFQQYELRRNFNLWDICSHFYYLLLASVLVVSSLWRNSCEVLPVIQIRNESTPCRSSNDNECKSWGTNSSSLPPANEVCEGYVFTGVCLSTGGVSLTETPLDRDPSRQRPSLAGHRTVTSGRYASYWNIFSFWRFF